MKTGVILMELSQLMNGDMPAGNICCEPHRHMAAGLFQNFCNWIKVGHFSRLIRVSHHVQLAALGSQPVLNHILCEFLGNLDQQLEPMLHARQCLFSMPRLLSPVIADLCLRPLTEVPSFRNPVLNESKHYLQHKLP